MTDHDSFVKENGIITSARNKLVKSSWYLILRSRSFVVAFSYFPSIVLEFVNVTVSSFRVLVSLLAMQLFLLNRNGEHFAPTEQELPSCDLGMHLHVTSFGHNYPHFINEVTTKLQLSSDDICSLSLSDVIQTPQCIFETTIGDPRGQSINKGNGNNNDAEDADFAGVLENLPTSYDDFESKELYFKLDRDLSSPLMACQNPNSGSNRASAGSCLTKSSNIYLCDGGSNPPDADDLEVAMINQSFEEQQKQTKLYSNPCLKNLFYSQPNTTDERVGVESFGKNQILHPNQSLLFGSSTHEINMNERLPFPTDLLLVGMPKNSVFNNSLIVGSPCAISQGKCEKTERSEMKSEMFNSSSSQDTASNPLSPIAKENCESIREFGYNGSCFDVEEMIFDTSRCALHEAFGDSLVAVKAMSDLMESQRTKKIEDSPISAADDNMAATEALAVDVVESLFNHSGLTETSIEDSDSNLVNGSDESKSNIPSPDRSNLATLVSLVDTEKKSESTDDKKERTGNVVRNSDAVDSWEELDNDDYSSKLVNEIETAMCKVKVRKPKIDYYSAPVVETWDNNLLPHVLEASNLLPKFTDDDVKKELAKYDCAADIAIYTVDDTHCLVVFASKSAAQQALISVRQRSNIAKLRLRSLCDATVATQDKARKFEQFLRPKVQRPQTTLLVARRLVEGALGKRSNVSPQQISYERKQLQEAKNLKQARRAIWGDRDR
ncbi:unnamed protein product [Thelazia callipaeda]|uniref:RRM domain-containing protein n=1 Tax=Thelazia callipaeda TaxID=103827 RepID=A0A0N5D965_THECL|nr:unnamed protein product [Thelazia callipaeda]